MQDSENEFSYDMHIIYKHIIDFSNTSFTNLVSLDCSHSNVLEIPSKYTRLRYLDVSNCPLIRYIPSEFIRLEKLFISMTNISKLPNTLTLLTELDCSYTKIAEIPSTFINLIKINILGTSIRTNKLKTMEYRDVNNALGNENQCLICLEQFEINTLVYKHTCKNITHIKCIICWNKISELCPVCKDIID